MAGLISIEGGKSSPGDRVGNWIRNTFNPPFDPARRDALKTMGSGLIALSALPLLERGETDRSTNIGGILHNLNLIGGHRIENVTPIVRSDGQIINTLDLSITSRDASRLNYNADSNHRYSKITFHGVTEDQANAILEIININDTLSRLEKGAIDVVEGIGTIVVAGKVISIQEDQLKRIKEQAARSGEIKGIIEGGAITALIGGAGILGYLLLQRAFQENALNPGVKAPIAATAELQNQGASNLEPGNNVLPQTTATATVDVETETPTVTITPLPSATPTATRTETPTHTLTLTPTELPMPKTVLFNGDFESGGINVTGYPGWNYLHQKGGKARVVPGRNGGNEIEVYVEGSPYLQDNNHEVRIALDWYNQGGYLNTRTIPAPCSVSCDVELSPELYSASVNRNGGAGEYPLWLNLLSMHTNRVVAGREIITNQGFSAGYVLTPRGLNMNWHYGDLGRASNNSTTSNLLPNTRKNLMIYIDENGRVLPYVDAKLAYNNINQAHKIDPRSATIGLTDGHGGMLFVINPNSKNHPPQGSSLRNDNFVVATY